MVAAVVVKVAAGAINSSKNPACPGGLATGCCCHDETVPHGFGGNLTGRGVTFSVLRGVALIGVALTTGAIGASGAVAGARCAMAAVVGAAM